MNNERKLTLTISTLPLCCNNCFWLVIGYFRSNCLGYYCNHRITWISQFKTFISLVIICAVHQWSISTFLHSRKESSLNPAKNTWYFKVALFDATENEWKRSMEMPRCTTHLQPWGKHCEETTSLLEGVWVNIRWKGTGAPVPAWARQPNPILHAPLFQTQPAGMMRCSLHHFSLSRPLFFSPPRILSYDKEWIERRKKQTAWYQTRICLCWCYCRDCLSTRATALSCA